MSEAATIERKIPPTERIAVKAKDAAALGGAWRDCLTAPAAARIPESQSTPSTEVRRGPWRYRGNFVRQIRRAVVRCAGVTFP